MKLLYFSQNLQIHFLVEIVAFWYKFQCNLKVWLTINQHGLRYAKQFIIWLSDGRVYSLIYASIDLWELNVMLINSTI